MTKQKRPLVLPKDNQLKQLTTKELETVTGGNIPKQPDSRTTPRWIGDDF